MIIQLMTILGLLAVQPRNVTREVVAGALIQAREAATYDPSYRSIPYPNGDIPRSKGVCTDVVIRAYRHAGIDLQRLIHEDMQRHFTAYPRRGKRTDTNIDHRRVPNQAYFFRTRGRTVSTATSGAARASWKPGDIVCWKLDNGLDHIGVLSDKIGQSGLPMVVHNLSVCREEDCLSEWRIVGHYRYPK